MEPWNKLNLTTYELKRIFKRIKYPGNEIDCWEHNMCEDKNGYATIMVKRIRYRFHRLIYQLYNGLINDELFVLHKCDNVKCVNPNHLFLGTHKENMKDMVIKNRQAKGSKQGTHILKEIDIIQIINDIHFNKYKSMSEVARNYNVSVTMISRILQGEFWSHISSNVIEELNTSFVEIKEKVNPYQKQEMMI